MAHNHHCWRKEYFKIVTLPLLFFVILWNTSLAENQAFDAYPTDTEVNPEKIVKLICRVRNRHGRCHWLKKHHSNESLQIKNPSPSYEYQEKPSNGDCSITILNPNLDKDDGYWQCQVSSDSDDQETLQSNTAKLTVRRAPEAPIIEHESKQFGTNVRYNTGENFVAQADKESKFTCISRRGNPPATLKWFIDNKEITANSVQRNESEMDMQKTFRASSSLTYTFQREHHEKKLRCVALHPAYNTGSMEIAVSLNISYIPTVNLEGAPKEDLAEGDPLTMKCVTSANPPATIIWKKSGQEFDYRETIRFNPVKRNHSGIYSCSAKNVLGNSKEINLMLDVKFKPNIIGVQPDSLTVMLYGTVTFNCMAESNPPGRYAWLQSIPGHKNTWQHRGSNSSLIIQNTTYSYQGKYVCEVSNMIAGKEHKATSKEIELDVVGPPQYLREHNNKEILTVEQDEDAVIAIIFCSDPGPKKIFWEWGSVKLDLENSMGRYASKPLIKEELPKACYEARLIIQNAKGSDARKYTLYVQNDKGETSFDVLLKVKEPVTMSAIIGIVIGCIVVIIIVILVVFYLLKKERCFIRSQGFHPESENSSQRLADELHNGRSPSKDRAIPPDALYTDVQAIRHYDNPKQSADPKRGTDGIVYADLDMLALKSEQPKLNKSHEKIEYAEIQFKPKDENNQE